MTVPPPDAVGTVPFGPHRTWYRVTGRLHDGGTALVVVHGGPGSTHDYLAGLAALAGPAGPVVHYDQLGNGGSTRLPGRDASFWTVRLFLDELDNLLTLLGVAGDYVLLGHSWGGTLAAAHAAGRPPGLRGLVVADAPASYPVWIGELARLRAALPDGVDEALRAHERAGTTDGADYLRLAMTFYDRHVCRLRPWPEGYTASFLETAADPTVYTAMNGPSEFHVDGTLREFSVVDLLPQIAVPTLVITGEHDEVTPDAARPFHDLVPDARWVVIDEASHVPHLEQPARFAEAVSGFVDVLALAGHVHNREADRP